MAKRVLQLLILAGVLGGAVWFFRGSIPGAGTTGGGRLNVSQRTEPDSFNRLVSAKFSVELISRLTSSPLVRVNRLTGAVEPALATDWTPSSDGLTYRLRLRPDVTFSDGTPFTSADVVFTFNVLYDGRLNSPLKTPLLVGDKPLVVRAIDEHTIELAFPAPYGPGLSILDAVPILPKHKLEAAFNGGTFATTWGLTTPPSEIVGIGPFVVASYQAGQQMTFARNTHYWAKDTDGKALPRLDELVMHFIPDQNAEMLQLEAGTIDVTTEQIRAEDYAALERASKEHKVQLVDAGVSVDPTGLWFNLTPNAPAAKTKPWLQKEELRHAISAAVDRQRIVDTVFLGAAEPTFGPITRGYGQWFVADLPRPATDVARAKTLLDSIGLKDRNNDGQREDAAGKPARIAVLTRKGNTALEKTMASVQEQLRAIGLGIDIVALDGGPLIKQFSSGDYEAMYYGAPVLSLDPANNADLWLSSGSFHFWNPGQSTPATPWEKQIDDLTNAHATAMDTAKRVSLFADVQRIFAEHEPMIFFAAPKVTVAMSARVSGAVPVVMQPQVLWKPETLAVTGAAVR